VNWYQRAVQARELIEQIIAKAQEFDYEDFLNKQLDRLEQLLHAYIQQELDEAKRAVIEALIEKVHELRAEIASSQTVADIKAYLVKAEELWAQAQVIFNTAVGDYHVIRPYVEQAISFGTFVAEYDFEGVTSLEEANVFLQELAAQYGELHSDFAGLANLSPGAQAIIDWTLQWTDDALLAALPYIEGIVDWQLANRLEINTGNIQLDTLIRDIARQTAESGLSTLKSIIENAPDATLAGLIAKSGQLNDVLRALAEVGNLAVSAKTWTVATIAEVLAQLETLKAQVAVFTQEAREHIEQLINNAKAFLEQAIAEGKQFISDLYEDIAAGAEQLIADLHKIRDYVENYLAEGKEELTARVNELIAQIEQASEEIAVLIPVIEDRLAELWADAVAAAAQAAEDAAEGVQLAVAAIDAAIRSIPDPRLLSTELALATDAQSAVLATNYEDFFATVAQLLGQYLDLDYVMPAYVTAALPQGFTLSADGQLSVDPAILVQTVEEYHNDTFTRTFGISIAVKTGIKEIDDLLANLGIPALVEQDVMVALALEPLDNPPVPPVSTLKGDANCDGFVAADDANLVARFVARLDTLTDQGKINGDMNDSGGNPTIGDAILIARRVAGFVD
jgi:hypothetical protein